MKINVFKSEKELQEARFINLLPALALLICFIIIRILDVSAFWVGLLVAMNFLSLAMYLFFPFYTNARLEFNDRNEILIIQKSSRHITKLDNIVSFSFTRCHLGIRTTMIDDNGSIVEFYFSRHVNNRPSSLYAMFLKEIDTRNSVLRRKIHIIPLDIEQQAAVNANKGA